MVIELPDKKMAYTSEVVLIPLHSVDDSERGTLCVAEFGKDIPFEIKRIFYLYNLSSDTVRGQHAHRKQEQFIMCLSGSVEVLTVQNGKESRFTLSQPNQGVYLPPMTWVRIKVLDISAIYLVVSSGLYEESDYIRNYEEFEKLLHDM